jgi:hypothetical protein
VDVLRVATKSNPNTDVLTSIAASAWARRSVKSGAAAGGGRGASAVDGDSAGGRQDAVGGKKTGEGGAPARSHGDEGVASMAPADQEPLLRALYIQAAARRALLHDLEQVLESARQESLGREGAGGAAEGRGGGGARGGGACYRSRLGFASSSSGGRGGGGEAAEAAGKVMVDMGMLTRSIQALEEAEAQQQRIQQLEQVLGKYEDAIVTTVAQCAEAWDYTQPAWRAPGTDAPTSMSGGKIVVIGGVRYEMEPGMHALRTVSKPHDLLQDPRLAVLREPFFSRGHGGRFGFQADVADRVRRVTSSLTAALKSSSHHAFPPPALPHHPHPLNEEGLWNSGAAPARGTGWDGEAARAGGEAAGMLGTAAAPPPLAASTTRYPPTFPPRTSPSPPLRGSPASPPTGAGGAGRGGGEAGEERREAIDALLRLDAEACRGLEALGGYYKALTALLAPEALLVEYQVRRGVVTGVRGGGRGNP